MSSVILACNFLFCDILSGFGIREMVSSQNVKNVPFSTIFLE